MFIGHYALAFGSNRLAPTVSLGALFVACQLADLLWPTLVLLGIERFTIAPGITRAAPFDFQYYPYSHSLVALAAWGVLLGVAYRLVTRSTWAAALVLCLLVPSHWVLDFIVHRPDLAMSLGRARKSGRSLELSTGHAGRRVFALCGGCLDLHQVNSRTRSHRLGRPPGPGPVSRRN